MERGGWRNTSSSVPTIHPSHTGGGFPLRLSFLTALFWNRKWHNFKAFMEDKVLFSETAVKKLPLKMGPRQLIGRLLSQQCVESVGDAYTSPYIYVK